MSLNLQCNRRYKAEMSKIILKQSLSQTNDMSMTHILLS